MLLALCTSSVAFAAGTVGTGTAGSCTEAAFDAALVGGGAVTFDCGAAPHTITLTTTKFITANTDINASTGSITLSGGNAVRLFDVAPGMDFSLFSIIVRDGLCGVAESGAAVTLTGPGTTGTFTNVGFYTNACVNNGGAIYALQSDVIIDNTTFSGNSSTGGAGGAMIVQAGTANILSSVFTNNSAVADPAVIGVVSSATIDIQNSYFNLNSYVGIGGARLLEIQAGSTGTITRTRIYQNTVGFDGMLANTGDLTITRSSMHDNTGIQVQNGDGILTISNSTIGNNDINGNLSAIAVSGTGTTDIIFSTLANNINGLFSGAVSETGPSSTVNISNSIIGNNSANSCTGNGIISLGGNIDQGNTCNFTDPSDQVNTDPLLLAFSTTNHLDFSGVTTGIFYLDSLSPAIDAASGGPLVDQVGRVRPLDGNANSVFDPDSGAVEFLPDLISPVIGQFQAVPTPDLDTTPSYTFSSNEAGTITYGGDCSSATAVAIVGFNTVVFNALAVGVHSNCTITVTDAALNVSNVLNVSSFEITAPPAPPASGGGGGGSGGCAICFPQPGSGSGSTQQPPVQPATLAQTPASPPMQTIENFFTDTPGHWAETFMENLHVQCGVDGYEDGDGNLLHLFRPDFQVTRAELITMLIKCKEGELAPVSATPFSDVSPNHWGAPYIKKAHEMNIVDGFGDGTFKPNQPANRAEALKMILLTWIPETTVASALPNTQCMDIDQNNWYADYFNYALNENIVSGYKDVQGNLTGECGPGKNVTRAEAAKMIDLARTG